MNIYSQGILVTFHNVYSSLKGRFPLSRNSYCVIIIEAMYGRLGVRVKVVPPQILLLSAAFHIVRFYFSLRA